VIGNVNRKKTAGKSSFHSPGEVQMTGIRFKESLRVLIVYFVNFVEDIVVAIEDFHAIPLNRKGYGFPVGNRILMPIY
jgi:hypothetical protein